MKSNLLKILRWILGIVVVLLLMVCLLFRNEIRSLLSLKKVDPFPLYQMTYFGDYGFDDFLKKGAKSDKDIERFVTKRLLKGLPINLGVIGDGCTAFVVKTENNETLFCRNFDFTYSPSLQVKTKPRHGYASVSTVNLTYAGYSKDNLPKVLGMNSFLTLAAPYLPFDGINEKGLAIALLAVPEVHAPNSDSKITLNTTTVIRLVLDKAKTIEEAVNLIKQYNVYFSGGVECHYLIADATGKSVLVEFWDNDVKTVSSTCDYQIASNFVAYNGINLGEGYTEFDRYDAVKKEIERSDHTLTIPVAVDLLSKVGVYDEDGTDKLQWSVIYNLNELNGEIFCNRKIHNIKQFSMEK